MTDVTPLIPKESQVITSYGNGGFGISGRRYDSSVIVFPDKVIPWNVGADISPDDFSEIIAAKEKIEILLFGSGQKMVFPPPEISKILRAAGIALEVMDTGAACRTYNILLAEERKVAAALRVV